MDFSPFRRPPPNRLSPSFRTSPTVPRRGSTWPSSSSSKGLIITSDETILEVNSAACELLQRSYPQLVGRPLAELFPSEAAFSRPAPRCSWKAHLEARCCSGCRMANVAGCVAWRLHGFGPAYALVLSRTSGLCLSPSSKHRRETISGRGWRPRSSRPCWWWTSSGASVQRMPRRKPP